MDLFEYGAKQSSGKAQPLADRMRPGSLPEFIGQTHLVGEGMLLTRAIEKAGGEVLFGIESTDSRRRWQAVTMGISDGDSLVREIRLEKRIR